MLFVDTGINSSLPWKQKAAELISGAAVLWWCRAVMGQCVLLSLLLSTSTPLYAAGLQVLRSEHRAGKTPLL